MMAFFDVLKFVKYPTYDILFGDVPVHRKTSTGAGWYNDKNIIMLTDGILTEIHCQTPKAPGSAGVL